MSDVRAERIAERRGRGVVVRGNDIDTDQIIPARYMTSIRFAGLEEFVFRDVRFTQDGMPKGHPIDDRRFRGASPVNTPQALSARDRDSAARATGAAGSRTTRRCRLPHAT